MEKRKGIYWQTHSEKKNVMKCDICGICGLSFQKHFGNIFGSTTIDQFFKLLKTFHKIYSAKILKLPDILSVYYLQATDLLSRSTWKKYSAKRLGRNIHLAEYTFTVLNVGGSKIEFLHGYKIWHYSIILFPALFCFVFYFFAIIF